MKKIILSVAVATMALSTAAAALEDIKVTGQAKLWYETDNADHAAVAGTDAVADTVLTVSDDNGDIGTVTLPGTGKAAVPGTPARSGSLFDKKDASGEVVFKLGVTGKQGNVGFGATVYQTSTMGLERDLVSGVRNGSNGLTGDGEMYTAEMYVTVPVGAKTLLKLGKQELDTPLAFTERWNLVPNTFNAAVAINNSIDNLTLIGAYVGQGNNGAEVTTAYIGSGTYAAAALYKADGIAVNVWGYNLASVAKALWADASFKAGPANLKVYAAQMMPDAAGAEDTTAFAISAAMKAGSVDLFAAASTVDDDGALGVGNTATYNSALAGKKTKLPTMAVYLDGRSVAAPGATAFKLKAATKIGSTGLALQGVMVDNDKNGVNTDAAGAVGKDATEIDLIASTKLGDVNLKGILMHRDFDTRDAQQHVRIIASVNF